MNKVDRNIRFKTKTEDGFDNHMVDLSGNHFINGVCVNPLQPKYADEEDFPIGSTIPPVGERLPWIDITHVATQEEHEQVVQEERAKQYKRENRE